MQTKNLKNIEYINKEPIGESVTNCIFLAQMIYLKKINFYIR